MGFVVLLVVIWTVAQAMPQPEKMVPQVTFAQAPAAVMHSVDSRERLVD
jgi:hypothetical protein